MECRASIVLKSLEDASTWCCFILRRNFEKKLFCWFLLFWLINITPWLSPRLCTSPSARFRSYSPNYYLIWQNTTLTLVFSFFLLLKNHENLCNHYRLYIGTLLKDSCICVFRRHGQFGRTSEDVLWQVCSIQQSQTRLEGWTVWQHQKSECYIESVINRIRHNKNCEHCREIIGDKYVQ